MGEITGFAKYPTRPLDNGGNLPHQQGMDLLSDIETFCGLHGLSDSQFGTLALNDKNFVPQLRDGRDIRLGTARRVCDFMTKYCPEQSA